jgi:hypothetical protein
MHRTCFSTQESYVNFMGIISKNGPYIKTSLTDSVADPDPGSGAFLTPGSGIGFFRIPYPGSRIPDPGSQTHTFDSLVTIFWAKSSIIL